MLTKNKEDCVFAVMLLYWFEKCASWCRQDDELKLLVIKRLLAKNEKLMSILRSCKIEDRFSDVEIDFEIKWLDRKWRCKSLLNANVSWQKRQIWKKRKDVRFRFDADIWQCEISAIWLIEANLIDVELRLLTKTLNLKNLIFDKSADLK